MKRRLVILLMCFLLVSGCTKEKNTPNILDQNNAIDDITITESGPVNNPFFFDNGDSKIVYKGLLMFDDIIEKDITLYINELADLTYGKLYELKLEHIEGVPDDRLRLGYFYVQQDTIYKIEPTEVNLNMIKASEELPDGSMIVCQDTEIKDVLREAEPGFHQFLKIQGDRREYHSYNNQVSTGYYESFIWERDNGLINYQSGYGAGRDSIELHLINLNPTLLGETPYISAIRNFIVSLKNNDAESLRRMISPSGLTVIRNFYSGFGNRGKDIRNLYTTDEIPDNLQFEVINEIPVTLHDFFEKTQQGEVSDIPVTQIIDCYFNFTDDVETKNFGPPTEEVRDLCSDLTSDYSPRIFELGEKEVVLTESSLINYTPLGVWAVFKKYDDQYLLRAVIDLR